MEERRRIEGWPGYWVTNTGRVWSDKSGRWLKPHRNEKGYPVLQLYDRGRCRGTYVHQLVAAAFLGPKPVGMETRHLNGDKQDNRPENLRYGTPRENRRDAFEHGTAVCPCVGAENPRAKLDEVAVTEIRNRYAAGGVLLRELGSEYGVSEATVCKIVNRQLWGHC